MTKGQEAKKKKKKTKTMNSLECFRCLVTDLQLTWFVYAVVAPSVSLSAQRELVAAAASSGSLERLYQLRREKENCKCIFRQLIFRRY